MESLGEFSGLLGFFLIAAAILALLLPFFVLKIRNEVVSMNKKMSELIEILGGIGGDTNLRKYKGKKIRICPHCGAKNRPEDWVCLNCSERIQSV